MDEVEDQAVDTVIGYILERYVAIARRSKKECQEQLVGRVGRGMYIGC